MIPAQAVEAAKKVAFERYGSKPDTAYLRTILEAAAPYMMAGVEWAIFRASDGLDGTPMENLRYTSREAAQKWINNGFRQPEFWEVRGRSVGTWQK